MRKLSLSFFLILFFSSQIALANEQLVFALDLIRHGARTGNADLPNAPHKWSEGRGQLTGVGMQQAYQLGLKLNQRYKIDTQLLPANYQANTMYIRSTDYDRTLMSAQSVLMGLYPLGTGPVLSDASPALPSNFQPIPVHTIPAAQDSAFLIDISSPEISRLLEQYVYSSDEWNAKSAELEPHYKRWSQLTGMSIQSMFDVWDLSDILHTYAVHDVANPPGLTKEDAQYIMDSGDWIYARLLKPAPVGNVVGKAALEQILGYINQAINKKSKTKFVLLSAHDVTTLAVMSALHAPLEYAPSYASDLNFSLYLSDSGNYIVKVTFNDKPVIIPGCKEGTMCQLDELKRMVE